MPRSLVTTWTPRGDHVHPRPEEIGELLVVGRDEETAWERVQAVDEIEAPRDDLAEGRKDQEAQQTDHEGAAEPAAEGHAVTLAEAFAGRQISARAPRPERAMVGLPRRGPPSWSGEPKPR
jgi:hypothetical protein